MTFEHDPFYRPREAAKRIGVGRTTLYAAVQRGDLEPPERVSLRAVAWRESQLLRYRQRLSERPPVQPVPNRKRKLPPDLAAA